MTSNPLMGLARRWLREQSAADHRADDRTDQIALDARREATHQLGDLLMPGLRRRVEQAAARRAAHEVAAEAARRAALLRVEGCTLQLAGDLDGPLPARLAVDVDREDDLLLLGVEPDDDEPEGTPFRALQLAVPGFVGEGEYDLRAAHTDGWDPDWFCLVADVVEEPFFWDPSAGACTVTIADGHADLRIAFTDVASRHVLLSGRLPLALPSR